MDLDQLWKAALSEIETSVSRPTFISWFKNSRLLDKQEGTALVALPNKLVKDWVEDKYSKTILSILRNLDETTKKIEFVVHHNPLTALSKPTLQAATQEGVGQLSFPEFKVDPETNLNPRYTLTSFVVGKSNELAFAAATAILQAIGKKYNPLFVYGGVGLGKTHLIQGLGNEIKGLYQGKVKVKYVSSEKFTNDVIWAIRNKRMETVKEKYREIDVLIVDDIQFIAGKAATEEEFFHTFNALHENSKQIIISSDRPPKFIPTLEERLRSRFEGGMIVDIGYPDYELRYAIVKTKLQEMNADLPEDIVGLVATKIQKSFRELEGTINRMLFHQSKSMNNHISLKEAETIINEIIQEPSRNINPNQVIKAVAEFAEISPLDLINRSRKKEVVEYRQIAMYLLREMLGMSYPYIGRRLGKRDHTTAIYACDKITQEINKNPALNQRVLMIKELINNNH